MEKKSYNTYCFLITALFVCVLLSFTVVLVTGVLFGSEDNIAETCYDGSVIEDGRIGARFLREIYQNKKTAAFIRTVEYRLFGIVGKANVVAGKEDFLFELRREENGYDYLKDYIGRSEFTEEESAAILLELQQREATFKEKGAEYLLVVIPNAQSVYSEYMPSYLGRISDHTRLSKLGEYLEEREYYSFVDLTQALLAAKSDGLLYNNTENSLNARGVYVAYRAVYGRFSEKVRAVTTPIDGRSLSFVEHRTAGKSIARAAGLEDAVQNNTVSLSNETAIQYTYLKNAEGVIKTQLKPAVAQGQNCSLLLQFSDNWEKLQSEPFYSNTFKKVTSVTGLSTDTAEAPDATVVIQFIYEYELASLLPTEMQRTR